jgi:hypothetical protein
LNSKLREVEGVKNKLVHHLNIAKMDLKTLEATKPSSTGKNLEAKSPSNPNEDMTKLEETIASLTVYNY